MRQTQTTILPVDSVSTEMASNSLPQTKMQSLFTSDSGDNNIREESPTKVATIRPLGSPACGEECQCRCHWSQQPSYSGAWMPGLLGSWLVRCQGIKGFRKLNCTERGCDSSNNMGVEVEYQLPSWLWAGVVSFRAYQSRWPPLNLSLRPPRTVAANHPVWCWIENPSVLRNQIRQGLVLFPDDSDESGQGLIEVGTLKRVILLDSRLGLNTIPTVCHLFRKLRECCTSARVVAPHTATTGASKVGLCI